MRRLAHALLVLLILPALVTGQVTVSSGGTFDGGTISTPINFPDGSVTVPSIAWSSDADGTGTGFYRRGANEITLTSNGVGIARFGNSAVDSSGLVIVGAAGAGILGWASAIGNNADLFLSREAAAILQIGADAASPPAQTFKAADAGGSDAIGASLTLAPGKGGGAGVSGSVILNRDLVTVSGSTAQTYGPAWISCPTKILSNTSATAQTMATITTTSTTGGSVKMFFTTVANNGTLQDTDAGEIVIGWNNNAGTVAVAASTVYGQMDSDASGTLATTPTVTAATNVVSIKFTPTWVTIVPTTVTGFATFEVNGVNSIACQ